MRALSFPKTKKGKAVVVAGVITVATAGGAYAYWSSLGTGTGAASTGTSSAFVVTTDAATGGPLTPGGPTQTVAFHVQNSNSGVQRLSAVAVTVAASNGTAWNAIPGCSAADYTIGTPSFTAGDVASGATKDGTVTITMNNLSSNQDACKNVSVPLYFSAS
jgi:hypothetical protein